METILSPNNRKYLFNYDAQKMEVMIRFPRMGFDRMLVMIFLGALGFLFACFWWFGNFKATLSSLELVIIPAVVLLAVPVFMIGQYEIFIASDKITKSFVLFGCRLFKYVVNIDEIVSYSFDEDDQVLKVDLPPDGESEENFMGIEGFRTNEEMAWFFDTLIQVSDEMIDIKASKKS